MCSTSVQRLAEIGRAIDDLAAQAQATSKEEGTARTAAVTGGAATAADSAGTTAEAAVTGAAETGDASAGALSAHGLASGDTEQVMQRLADLWAKLAQLDPEVAKRLPTYEA